MLTEVLLEGPLGAEFGREWELDVASPAEALRLVDANRGNRLFDWIASHLEEYENYRVVVEYADGSFEYLDEDTFPLHREMRRVSFVPLVAGEGNVGRIIAGVVMIAVGALLAFTGVGAFLGQYATGVGVGMMFGGLSSVVGGVAGLLTPTPKTPTQGSTHANHYFDGPANTTVQGAPVPLVYGRVLTGSQVVSVQYDIDDTAVSKDGDNQPDNLALLQA